MTDVTVVQYKQTNRRDQKTTPRRRLLRRIAERINMRSRWARSSVPSFRISELGRSHALMCFVEPVKINGAFYRWAENKPSSTSECWRILLNWKSARPRGSRMMPPTGFKICLRSRVILTFKLVTPKVDRFMPFCPCPAVHLSQSVHSFSKHRVQKFRDGRTRRKHYASGQ